MKKISILLMLMALFAPWAVNAQETLTVCEGTTTSSYAPIKSNGGSQTEFIYPATLLSDMEGGTITSVKFFSSSTSTTNYSNTVTVYVQEVDATTETTSAWRYNQTTATKVYEGTTLSVTGGELVITFSTPYEYNGGNLCFNIWSASNTPTVNYYYLSTTSACGYDWYITPPVNNPFSTGAYLPKAEFTYTPAGGCANGCECFEDCTALTSTSLGSSGSTPAANLPSGWKGYGTSYYPYAATFTSYMGDDADGQFMYFKSTTTGATYLALPDQYVTEVNFDYAYETNAYSGLKLEIGYMTDISSSTWYNNTFYSLKTMTNNGETWGSETQDFSSVTASTYYVVFKFSQSYSSWYSAAIDNVCLTISVPSIALNPSSATVLTGFTQTLTATTENVHGTPTITYTSSNTNVATVSGSGTTATVTGVSAGTATITATMTYGGNTYNATCTITVEDPSYCEPHYSQTSDYIKSFVTTGGATNINNTNTGQGTGGYSDFYNSHSASISDGETLSFTVTRGYNDSYKYAIWVDWNHNYVFDVNTETMAQQTTSVTQDWSSSFTIPVGTAAGDYRMRVEMLYGSSNTLNPCVSATYGEVEDYKLTVLASGAYTITCATTTGGTISADKTNADENDVVTITATPDTDYLLTALTYTPEGGSAQNIDITNTPYTFTMPAANVTVNATFSLPACPKPTNLTVSNLAASHATVSWDSEAGNYTVKYSTATVSGTTLDPVFEDGFESGLGNWTTYAMGYDNSSYNWQQYDLYNAEVEPYNHSGSYVAMSRSWVSGTGDKSVDNWLVTPQMTLGDVVKFWVSCNDEYRDSYAVYVSTGSNIVTSSTSIGDFVLVKSYAEATGTWEEISIDISAHAGQQGYVAIRHTNYGGDKLNVDDFGVYNTINTYSYGTWTTVNPNPTTESCQLTGLSAETLYEVQVQANCGGTDGSSAWSTIHFTTPDNCGAPQELASSNITATSATLSWADDKDSYNVRYREVYFYEDFEGSDAIPTGWTTINNSSTAGTLNWQVLHMTNHSGNNSVGSGSYIYQNTGITPDNWLISPQLDLQGTLRVWLSGYPRAGSYYNEHFEILLSTTGTSVSDFTTTLVAESTTTNSYVEYTADLSSYTGKGYIAIHHFNCSDQNYLCVDDFGIYGSENWVALTPNPTTETANLTGLTPIIENGNHLLPTTYEWQVRGVNCDGNGGTTEWSDVATFTTLEGYVLPITAWGTGSGWYLISSPIGNVDPANVTNMISDNLGNTATPSTGTYDLYAFNQNQDLEWANYRNNNFNLVPGQGYLYANKDDVTLVFSGTAYNESGEFELTYTTGNTDEDMHGWNLVGNPFPVAATIDPWDYMRMNDDHTEIVLYNPADENEIPVAPMEGIFVHATASGQSVTFTKVQSGSKTTTNSEAIVVNISKDQKLIDRAAVRFGEGNQLPKYQLRQNSTKIYFPVDGEDFAVVRSEGIGELPVSFKAEENGNYTLSLNTNGVSFGYLHLIDNMTGNDVDMLANPSYSFEARTSDYSHRFKLVFATGDNTNDTFAYFSNGSFVINNDGKATLQVIDITGRILKSESINGCANLNFNAAPGVYMIRLVNGTDVKVQKVVVK